MKKTIVVVECYSSSVNYIHDIRKLGYEPILLELYSPQIDMTKIRAINDKAYAFIEEPIPQILQAEKTYEKTLKMISKLSPVLILAGADTGLELSLKLSSDLKLKSNPLSIFLNLRDKFMMQEILKNSGLRYIKSCIIRSVEEAVNLYRNEFGKKVVIKPTQSAASKNVFVCGSEAEVKNAFCINEQFIKQRNKKEEKIIMQEYIDGQEYAVDTISCESTHAALFGMKYKKRICKGFGKIYDTDFYFSPDDIAMKELVDYCFKVLSCLGIQYGCVHSEFIIDEKGPVLIEVNARPAGAFQKYTFQDKVMENHETAVSLESYFMDKKHFFERYPERMHLKQPAVVKQICLEKDIYVKKVKIKERLSSLKSFEYVLDKGDNCIYSKTVDLDTNGGMIYLTAPKYEIIERDLQEILALEKEGLDEFYDRY